MDEEPGADEENLQSLQLRVKQLIEAINTGAKKTGIMTFMILYDIENNKVRTVLAKYLVKSGCIRIQKSVYIANLKPHQFKKIQTDLKEVQAAYENNDSIILVPLNTEDARSMKIIGKALHIEAIIENPNTIIF